MTTRRTRKLLAVALVAAALVLGACSGDDNADDKDPEPTTTSLPKECEGVEIAAPADGESDSATTTTLPPDCADAVFTAIIDDKGSKELRELDADQQLGFGRGMCAYASALQANPEGAPSYDELIASTAASWGTSEAVVEEVIGLAANLCPGQLDPVLELRTNVAKVAVQITGTGTGELEVSYTTADGGNLQDTVGSPWEQQVILDEPVDVRVAVSGKGEVTCAFSVDGEELASDTATDGEAVCNASAAEVRDAAR